MNNKEIQKKIKELEKYYSQFPDWYWKFGLHDAIVISISELQLPPDWKSENPHYNCLEICLDARESYESDIKKISLFNYKLKTPPIDVFNCTNLWWLGNTLTKLPNKHFNLDIELEKGHRNHIFLNVDFEVAEIERK